MQWKPKEALPPGSTAITGSLSLKGLFNLSHSRAQDGTDPQRMTTWFALGKQNLKAEKVYRKLVIKR